MIDYGKPRIGLLGLMTDGYEPIFPGITKRQEDYANEIVKSVSDNVELYFPGAAMNRADIEKKVKEFNEKELDGILIILLTYSQGSWIVRALQENKLPIALAVVQPDNVVDEKWFELDLTVNQGVHGAQDNSNAIVRMGLPCEFFVGNRHNPEFKEFVTDFAKAAQTSRLLKRMRVAVIGKMSGMCDILNDELSVLKKIGAEYVHENVGTVYSFMEKITQKEIDQQIAKNHEIFDVDKKLTIERHEFAVRMYLGFRNFLTEGGYDSFTAHFDVFGADGRFKQLPLMAASHLMADGFGYAAEGDALCATMVSAAHCLGDMKANFTEMYTIDFEKDAIIFCHAGEGNWATCRRDMKPKLIDRYFGEGGLDNPPTPIFTPQFGAATLTCLAPVVGDEYKMIISNGEILAKTDMVNCEMPYFFYRPDTGAAKCVENWIRNGGTHHEVINLGQIKRRWEMLANILGVQTVTV